MDVVESTAVAIAVLFVLALMVLIGYNQGYKDGYSRGCDDVLINNKSKISIKSTAGK